MFQTLMLLIVVALEHQVFKHCKKQPHPFGFGIVVACQAINRKL